MNVLESKTLTDNNGNYQIDDCLLHKYNNIESYNYGLCKSELTISYNTNINIEIDIPIEVYYIFDCPGEDALFHWIGECFIFYPVMLQLQEIYPNVKILTKNTKKYVRNIFNFFNIKNEIVNNIQTANNICFFSPILALNDMSHNIELYKKYVNIYIQNINTQLLNFKLPLNNKIVLLPRNNNDNYAPNDRILPGIEDIEENIISIGGIVLNTYQINNIKLQWSILENSEIIILDMGSSFFFNCIFLKNKTIILLNNHGLSWHINSFNSLQIIYNIIIEHNKVIVVNPINDKIITYKEIKEYILI